MPIEKPKLGLIFCVVGFLLTACAYIDQAVNKKDDWPLSDYSMYSSFGKKEKFYILRLEGIDTLGNPVALESDEYIYPFHSVSPLRKIIFKNLQNPEGLDNIFEMIQTNARKNYKPLSEISLYRLEWEAKPNGELPYTIHSRYLVKRVLYN